MFPDPQDKPDTPDGGRVKGPPAPPAGAKADPPADGPDSGAELEQGDGVDLLAVGEDGRPALEGGTQFVDLTLEKVDVVDADGTLVPADHDPSDLQVAVLTIAEGTDVDDLPEAVLVDFRVIGRSRQARRRAVRSCVIQSPRIGHRVLGRLFGVNKDTITNDLRAISSATLERVTNHDAAEEIGEAFNFYTFMRDLALADMAQVKPGSNMRAAHFRNAITSQERIDEVAFRLGLWREAPKELIIGGQAADPRKAIAATLSNEELADALTGRSRREAANGDNGEDVPDPTGD